MAKRREFTREEILDICKTYQETLVRKPLAKKYQCTDKVILRVLLENGIKIRHINTRPDDNRKYKVNDNYFNMNNQTANSAYILGILASDGCVASSQNQIYIELKKDDRELLEKINNEIQNERPVKDYFNQSKNYFNSKLYFFSKQIKEDLSKYNIIPNKTKYTTLSFIKNIKDEYKIDYIRGHFDGDGNIKWSKGICWQIDSTSLETLLDIQKVLKNYGIETRVVEKKDKSVVNLKVYRIYFYGKKEALKLYKLFYNKPSTAILRMQRKQQHFAELLLKYSSQESLGL